MSFASQNEVQDFSFTYPNKDYVMIFYYFLKFNNARFATALANIYV